MTQQRSFMTSLWLFVSINSPRSTLQSGSILVVKIVLNVLVHVFCWELKIHLFQLWIGRAMRLLSSRLVLDLVSMPPSSVDHQKGSVQEVSHLVLFPLCVSQTLSQKLSRVEERPGAQHVWCNSTPITPILKTLSRASLVRRSGLRF